MIDLNKGVTMRNHPSMKIRVCMYKSDPGRFWTLSGDPVPEDVARGAGFDVDALKKEAVKREKLEAARAQIEAEYAKVEREIAQDDGQGEAVEAGDYEIKHIGAGRYAVMGPDGERLTPEPLTKREAEQALKSYQQQEVSHGKTS